MLNKVRANYSIIGDFVQFLIKNEQRIKNLLLDYEIETKVDKLNNGQEVKTLIFTNKNIRILFAPVRIDYTYTFLTKNDLLETSFNNAKTFFNLLGEIFPEIVGKRIAIVLNSFVENLNNNTLCLLTDKMNLNSSFGNCNELAFKINTPIIGGKELYNSVVNLDMGNATNRNTNEQINVLLLSFDVNTMANNTNNRFYASNFTFDFSELFEKVEERIQQMEHFLE